VILGFVFDALVGSLPSKVQALLGLGCLGLIVLAAVAYFGFHFGFWLGS
jgi:hypothetical protein